MDSQQLKIEDLKLQIDCLKEKNETIVNYANDRLRKLMGSQKITEINEKVYRDVRQYLEDKEHSLSRRVSISLDRL